MTATAHDGRHSYDNTMLSKCGFSDPDRRSEKHDLACQFLMQESVVIRLADLFLAKFKKPLQGECTTSHSYQTRKYMSIFKCFSMGKSSGEVLVSKGYGQYQTTIGFIDVVLKILRLGERSIDGELDEKEDIVFSQIAIEVKSTKTPISDVIRQIRIYREYFIPDQSHDGAAIWLMASPWGITPADREALHREQIGHVRLGIEFDKFVEKCKAMPESQSDAVF